MTHLSHSVHQTEQIAAELAKTFKGGECVALNGDLGAGKTQFVRGIVQGLQGNPQAVSSPTFMLLNVYDGGLLKVFHLDAYRIHGAEDFEAIGFAELLEQDGVVIVEWASRVEPLLPDVKRIDVNISSTGEQSRAIEIIVR